MRKLISWGTSYTFRADFFYVSFKDVGLLLAGLVFFCRSVVVFVSADNELIINERQKYQPTSQPVICGW